MRLYSLPLTLLLCIFNAPSADASLVPSAVTRAAQRAHRIAIRHSRGLAGDLRVAFGAVLVQEPAGSGPQNRAVYCSVNRAGGHGLGGSDVDPGSNSSTSDGIPGPSSSGASSSSKTASGSSSTKAGAPPSSTATANSSPWSLMEEHTGSNFFDGWDFFQGGDPTSGTVSYVDENTGRSSGLVSVNGAGRAVMSVETTGTVSDTRKSIRITTKSHINFGLVIMDAIHMPTGCGTWPAFWTNGPQWPTTGEIDIVEGVGDYTNNQATIHTASGCTVGASSSSALGITGSLVGGTDCAALTTGNQGCGVRSSSSVSFGAAFNNNGGGVYAMQWDEDGIQIWFFPRSNIPSDISAGAPLSTKWGQPMARWPADKCNPTQFFKDHSVIFDTTLCGDWAGGVWSSSGIPGQEQSCAARTGFSTCEAYVRASGSSLQQAYWEVNYVRIYQAKN